MDSYDAHPSTGASAAGPAAPPRTRREAREFVFDAVVDTDPFDFALPASDTRRQRRELDGAPAAVAHRHEERQPGTLARRTALTFAGSGAALVGVAVATHRAPDESTLDQATRNLVAEPGKTVMAPAAPAAHAAKTGKAGQTAAPNHAPAKVEYQTTAAGKAPKAAVAPTVKQPSTVLSLDPAVHLARRATWGPTPATVRQIRKMGAAKWLESQLKPSHIADTRLAAYLKGFDTLGATPQMLRSMNEQRQQQDYWYAHDQLEAAAIARAVWSERQLFEVVVDFLHSRLHVPAHIDKSRDFLNHYDAVVIRKHAFGKFKDMLWAMITHPAMIVYLDNQNNTKNGGNQNLGRELLELHTLGVDAGYKQADVAAAAALLTGLSVDQNGAMVYLPDQHQTGAVKVFGHRYANASAAGGLATIKSSDHEPRENRHTAHYFALDLARRFVSDAPSKKLVNRLAAIYLKNDTAIVPVLRALFNSPEFKHSVGQVPAPAGERRRDHAGARRQAGRCGAVHALARRSALPAGPGRAGAARACHARRLPGLRPAVAVQRRRPRSLEPRHVARRRMAQGLHDAGLLEILAGATTYGAAVDKLFLALTFQKPTAATRRALLAFLQRRPTPRSPRRPEPATTTSGSSCPRSSSADRITSCGDDDNLRSRKPSP